MKEQHLTTRDDTSYSLLDSGEGEKLERFGTIVLRRPDPQALWRKRHSPKEWGSADAAFERAGKEGAWRARAKLPDSWPLDFGGLIFELRPTSFKHTGVFPEQFSNWEWAGERVRTAGKSVRVLNLFGYTGGATLAAAKAGAQVVHVDASKTAVAWAKKNASLSGIPEDSIRWIVEDVMTFIKREVRRGSRYDAIIMDPPAFGRGTDRQVWKIEEDFLALMDVCKELLSDTPLFFVASGYASGYSPLAFAYNLSWLEDTFGGDVSYGELRIEEKGSGRQLPAGIYARWAK